MDGWSARAAVARELARALARALLRLGEGYEHAFPSAAAAAHHPAAVTARARVRGGVSTDVRAGEGRHRHDPPRRDASSDRNVVARATPRATNADEDDDGAHESARDPAKRRCVSTMRAPPLWRDAVLRASNSNHDTRRHIHNQ